MKWVILLIVAVCSHGLFAADEAPAKKTEKPVNFIPANPDAVPKDVKLSPTLGAPAPKDAVVLFDGKNLDAWAKKAGKDWLKEDGPAKWKLVDGAAEVVPATDGGILSHQKFTDYHLHAEFRTLGAPSNSGIYLETRYEANINETYGK